MKSGTAKSYTPEEAVDQILQFVRILGNHFLENPTLFEAEGVFRKVGGSEHVESLSQAIIDGDKSKIETMLSEYSEIDKSSAFKTIRNVPLFQDSKSIAELKEILFSNQDDNEKANQFAAYIDQLAHSDKLIDKMRAEILYRYVHLLKECSKYSQQSKMSASNLAIASLGPALMEWLNISGMDQVLKIDTFNIISTKAIESSHFENSFQEKYGEEVAQWYNTKLNDLEVEGQGIEKENQDIHHDIENMEKREAKIEQSIETREKAFKKIKDKEDKKLAAQALEQLKSGRTQNTTQLEAQKSKLASVENRMHEHSQKVDMLKNYMSTPDTRKQLVFHQSSTADAARPKHIAKKETKRELLKKTITRNKLQ